MTDEKTFNIPLRKEFQKAPAYKRAKKTISAIKQFLIKHMKTDEIKLGTSINLKVWERGIKNPPHHIKVVAEKDDKGVVKAELFGAKKEDDKKTDKTEAKAEKSEEKKTEKEETSNLEKSAEKAPEENIKK